MPASPMNYSILIHTSGKRADHSIDYEEVVRTFNILNKESDEKFEKCVHLDTCTCSYNFVQLGI